MNYLANLFSSAVTSLTSIKSLFARQEKAAQERHDLAQKRNNNIDPRLNSIQVMVGKAEIPVEDLRTTTAELVSKVKELKEEEKLLALQHSRIQIADKVALDKLISEAQTDVENAKKELEDIKEKSAAQEKRLKESLEAERTSNMRVGMMKDQILDLEKKTHTMRADYESQKDRLMEDLRELQKTYDQTKESINSVTFRLASIQSATETLMKNAPHEATPCIVSALIETKTNRETVRAMMGSLKTMENSNGDPAEDVIDNFVSALPKEKEAESVVAQIRGRIAVGHEMQKMSAQENGPSLKERMKKLKEIKDAKEEEKIQKFAAKSK